MLQDYLASRDPEWLDVERQHSSRVCRLSVQHLIGFRPNDKSQRNEATYDCV